MDTLRNMNMYQPPHKMDPIHSAGFVVDDTNKRALRWPSGQLLDVDKILSSKLNSMSMEERTQGIHELHGVADEEVETPETLDSRLQEMAKVVHYFPSEDTFVYRLAVEMDKEYVEGIKLLCLRAEKYDSEKAARRLVAFFLFKQQLFGDEKLGRDITLADFQGEDKVGLNNGPVQLLQQRDRAGRAIIIIVGTAGSEFSLETCVSTLPTDVDACITFPLLILIVDVLYHFFLF
jgi:hypothetical protein